MGEFKPKTEEEVRRTVLPAGIYDAEIRECDEIERRKTGAPMYLLRLVVWDLKGEEHTINDCVGTDFMEHRLRHMAYSCGIGDLYESGRIDAGDLTGRSCKVKTFIQIHDEYGQQAKVRDYIVAADKADKYSESIDGIGTKTKQAPIENEADIPF